MGTLDSVTCTSAIFAWWKVRGGKFAQPLDGGVFESGPFRGGLYVTVAVTLTKSLSRTPMARSECARQSHRTQSRSHGVSSAVTGALSVGGAGAQSGRPGSVRASRAALVMHNEADQTDGHTPALADPIASPHRTVGVAQRIERRHGRVAGGRRRAPSVGFCAVRLSWALWVM